ncbi:hypothetical protein Tco_0375020 [Tanacetum coccineum]
MPPKGMSAAAIQKLVANKVAKVLAADRAARNNPNVAGGLGRNGRQGGAPPVWECSFVGFMKCGPTQFHSNEGANGEIMIDELKGKFNGMSIEINKKKELLQQDQAANVSIHTPEPSRRFNIIYDYEDDNEESTILLNEITSQIPPITPVLPTMEPEDSLIMGDEDLSTIPEKESDEVIKSSVEYLIPIPSESEDAFGSDRRAHPDEDVPEDNVQIYSNPLFEFDDEYISSDVNPLFDEVLEDIKSGEVDEIELLLHRDPSTPKISVPSILEGFTDEPPLEENDDLFDLESKENEWKKILYDAPIDDLMTEDKVFDPGIPEKIFLQHM